MYNLVIFSDEEDFINKLEKILYKYAETNEINFNIVSYGNVEYFFADYKMNYDLLFIDIDLTDINSIELSKRVREQDKMIEIVFVTYLAKYAIKGYDVSAIDFIVKPLEYDVISSKMSRILSSIDYNKKKDSVVIPLVRKIVKLYLNDIVFVEIYSHDIIIHTVYGEYRSYGSMVMIQKLLSDDIFSKANRSTLVNLEWIKKIDGSNVIVGNTSVSISRPRKKDFLICYRKYVEKNYKHFDF